MKSKIKTPEDVAGEETRTKKDYNCYLTIERVEYLKKRAPGVPVSKLIDAAIEAYIQMIKDNKPSK
jgi:hypothetical protein